jgi:hypothetical protein
MLKKPILLPIAGQDFSIPSNILNPKFSFGKNCRVENGLIVPREGHSDYSNILLTGAVMTGAILHFGKMQQSDQTLLMSRFSATKSQVYNPGTDNWDDITKSGSDWSTIDGTDYYDSAVYIDTLLVTNGKDNIQKYIGSGLMTDLGGSPPIAKHIETVGEYIMLSDVTDGGTRYPWRIQWNDTGDITDWSSGNAGYFDLLDNDQKIIGMKKLNENLVVFKEKTIYIGRLIDTSDIWNFDLIESGQELLNNRSLVEFRGKIYYLGIDGNIYVFNGYSSVPIGDKIQNEIGRVLNAERFGMSFGRVNSFRKCIEFFICQNGYDYCNFRWALNYEDGSIFYDTFDVGISSATTFKDTSAQLAYNDFDDTVTYGNITRVYDEDLGGTGFEFKMIGKSNGKAYKEDSTYFNDDTEAIEQEFVTPDINLNDHERLNRWSHVVGQFLGVSVTVYYSINYGVDYFVIPYSSTQNNFDLTPQFVNYSFWKDLKAQYIRFKFLNVDIDSYYTLRQLAVYGQLAEEVYQ